MTSPKLAMSEEEICVRYKQAKDPKEQIRILAELNACSVTTIEQILKQNDCMMPEKEKRIVERWTKEEAEKLWQLRAEGYTIERIAPELGRTVSAVKHYLWAHPRPLREKTVDRPMEKPMDMPADKPDQPDQTAKADAEKPRLSLVPPQIIWDIAEVREYGTRKYGDPDNWKRVELDRYVDALYRHFLRFMADPESKDEESGIEHYKHMACNAAFIAALMHKEG